MPTRIVEYYGDVPVFIKELEVQKTAFLMLDAYSYVEYGIQTIKIDKTWNEIVNDAKELAPKEIEAIQNNNTDGR